MKIRSKNKVKKTAGNNAFLAKVKRAMNAPTFATTAKLVNIEDEDVARAYLQQFFAGPVDVALDRLIATLDA